MALGYAKRMALPKNLGCDFLAEPEKFGRLAPSRA